MARAVRQDPGSKSGGQNPGAKPVEPAPELYPPHRHPTVLRFFCLEGELKAEPIRKALAELGTKEAECRIAYAPTSGGSRRGRCFFAIESPAAVPIKEVEKALRKGAEKVEELAFTCFVGEERPMPKTPSDGSGWSARDFVIGMMANLRWFDRVGGWTQFDYVPGKVDSAEILDRYKKLVAGYGAGDLGTVVRESFSWELAEPVDEKAARSAEKAIGKIEGVKEAKIDTAKRMLKVTVELDGLRISGAGRAFEMTDNQKASMDPAQTPPKACFETNAVIDALEREHIGLAGGK